MSSREHAARLLAAPAALVQLSLIEAKIVVSYMRPEKVPAGVTFITEGDADNTGFMVLLLDGEVVVESITVSRTHPVTTAVLGPGSLVGRNGPAGHRPALSVLHGQHRHPVCGADPPGAGGADRRSSPALARSSCWRFRHVSPSATATPRKNSSSLPVWRPPCRKNSTSSPELRLSAMFFSRSAPSTRILMVCMGNICRSPMAQTVAVAPVQTGDGGYGCRRSIPPAPTRGGGGARWTHAPARC
jgi:hypothetical protein